MGSRESLPERAIALGTVAVGLFALGISSAMLPSMADKGGNNTLRKCCISTRAGALCLRLRDLAATHLLRFEVLVEKVQSFLVGGRTSSDSEHALAGLVMGCLGNGDASA